MGDREQMALLTSELLTEVRLRIWDKNLPRNPAWGEDYDPVAILRNPRSQPEHVTAALVNLRIALHPHERWGKCAECGVVFPQVTEGQVTCSYDCYENYLRYMNTGSPGDPRLAASRDIAFHGRRHCN